MLVVGRGLCRLCQPIVQVAHPGLHRMAPLPAVTVSGDRPEAKRGTLGAGLRQRELNQSTHQAVGDSGVAVVMPGNAAARMV